MKQLLIKRQIVLLLLVLVLTACSPARSLKELDQKAGEIFFSKQGQEQPSDASAGRQSDAPAKDSGQEGDISAEIKKQIDKWLDENGYNRYGDPEGTFYSGGTPLFDEASGKSIERYDYILKQIPDIISKIE